MMSQVLQLTFSFWKAVGAKGHSWEDVHDDAVLFNLLKVWCTEIERAAELE